VPPSNVNQVITINRVNHRGPDSFGHATLLFIATPEVGI
jgi:hypothetical protein